MSLNTINLIEEYQHKSQNKEAQNLLSSPLVYQDIWHTINDLNLENSEHNRRLTLNFSKIAQPWLKLLVKLYVMTLVKNWNKANSIHTNLNHLIQFCNFLDSQCVYSPNQLNNQIFEAFEYHLLSIGRKNNTIRGCFSTLSSFFDVCRIEGWLDINTYWFRGKHKIHHPNNSEIKFIPEEVWNQLDRNLHHLPEPLQRMVLVIRTTGERIGEVCNMPFDCLRQRDGKWRIRFKTEKYNIEDELPIAVPELVAVIREQQEYIRYHLGEKYDKLFCSNKGQSSSENGKKGWGFSPVPKVMRSGPFNNWLNKLAKEYDIRTQEGELWHFQSHQFRRTVATVMANAGIRDLIIMKYLRHRSPDMLRHYVHLLKRVLGDEFEELMRERKYVDITGKVIASYKPKNPITEVLRQKMHQITTQYGECHRPDIKDDCQTINACWQCQNWHTSTDDLPYLKDDLKRVESEIEIVNRMGMIRQQKGLEGNRHILLKRIKGLEEIND